MGFKNNYALKCKVCTSQNMHKFLSLGMMPLANQFVRKEELNKEQSYYPLDVYFCEECFFVQIGYVVDPKVLFKDYIYVSSTSETLKRQFKEFADDVKARVKKNSFIVEIASNDGTLLKNFHGYRILGVEPASNIAKIAVSNGIPTLNKFFNAKTAKEIVRKYGKADAVIGTNIFAHIPDLNNFIDAVKILMNEDGFAVFESPYLADLMGKMEFDTIYHEHIYYLAVKPLLLLFKSHGVNLFDIKRTKMHGGSIRFFVGNGKYKKEKSVDELLFLESKMGLGKRMAYDDFASKVVKLKIRLNDLLGRLRMAGHSIAGYGAPAKGNTLLNYTGLGNEILDYIVDKNALKQGLYTPGKRIPIFSPDVLLKERPDYMLILAWNFADEIMENLKKYKERGGKFIIPIPGPKII